MVKQCEAIWILEIILYFTDNVKVKVKAKVNFTVEQATKAQRGSRGIALLFHDHGIRRW